MLAVSPKQEGKSSKGKGALPTKLVEVKGRARGDSQESSLCLELEPKRRKHSNTQEPSTPPTRASRVHFPEPLHESGGGRGNTLKQRIQPETQDSTNTDQVGVDSLQLSEDHLNQQLAKDVSDCLEVAQSEASAPAEVDAASASVEADAASAPVEADAASAPVAEADAASAGTVARCLPGTTTKEYNKVYHKFLRHCKNPKCPSEIATKLATSDRAQRGRPKEMRRRLGVRRDE